MRVEGAVLDPPEELAENAPPEADEEPTFRVTIGETEYVVPVKCPHREGRLNHGYLNERKGWITCPLHFSVFDLATGEVIAGPSCDRLDVVALPCRKA